MRFVWTGNGYVILEQKETFDEMSWRRHLGRVKWV